MEVPGREVASSCREEDDVVPCRLPLDCLNPAREVREVLEVTLLLGSRGGSGFLNDSREFDWLQ